MDFKVENFLSAHSLEILSRTGLHKTAAVLNGLDEMTIKHAVSIIGTKARQKRAEAVLITDGIAALAQLRGEKFAALPALGKWLPHVTGGIPAGLLGAGIGYALSPQDPETEKRMMIQAGLMGLLGGTMHSVHKGL
jgi:hypothetical protein